MFIYFHNKYLAATNAGNSYSSKILFIFPPKYVYMLRFMEKCRNYFL